MGGRGEALAKEGLVCYTIESIRVPLKGSTLELEEGQPNSGWRMGGQGQGAQRATN